MYYIKKEKIGVYHLIYRKFLWMSEFIETWNTNESAMVRLQELTGKRENYS